MSRGDRIGQCVFQGLVEDIDTKNIHKPKNTIYLSLVNLVSENNQTAWPSLDHLVVFKSPVFDPPCPPVPMLSSKPKVMKILKSPKRQGPRRITAGFPCFWHFFWWFVVPFENDRCHFLSFSSQKGFGHKKPFQNANQVLPLTLMNQNWIFWTFWNWCFQIIYRRFEKFDFLDKLLWISMDLKTTNLRTHVNQTATFSNWFQTGTWSTKVCLNSFETMISWTPIPIYSNGLKDFFAT